MAPADYFAAVSDRDDILDDAGADLRGGGGFSPDTLAAVHAAARWSRYYLYLLAGGLLLALISQTVTAQTNALGAAALAGNLVSYAFLAALLGYPVYHFHRFATLPERGEEGPALISLGASLKYLGILTVVFVGLYVGIAILALLVMGIALNAS